MFSQQANWHAPVGVLFDAATVSKRVQELGRQITEVYAGESLCVVGVLKGSFVFMADLVRAIDMPVSCEFIGISSYGDETKSSGVVQITSDLTHSINNENVLIVEDIIDSGLTMRYLLDNFATRKPRSLRVCALLNKAENKTVEVSVDYVGFEIPNVFVVGYGLDVAGAYRNLPHIGIYHGSA